MATIGRGYAATYLIGRAEMLSQAQAEVRAQVTNEVAAAAAERKLLIGMIKHYDQQVEEYDKMLAKARTAEGKSRQGRTVRTSTSAGTESYVLPATITGGLRGSQDALGVAKDRALASVKPTAEFTGAVRELKAAVRTQFGEPNSEGGNSRLAYVRALQEPLIALIEADDMESAQKAASIAYAGEALGAAVGGIGKNADAGALLTAQWNSFHGPDTAPFRTPELRAAEKERIEASFGGEAAAAGIASSAEVIAGGPFHQGPGRYSSSSTETLAPGEAARLAKYETPEFKMLAQAYGDDGVIDAAEAKVLTESGVDQDAFLDDVLMQRIMGRGRVTAERESLVGVRRGYREQAASQPGVDTSRERVRGLTRERYGPGGVSATEALLRPKRAVKKAAPMSMRDYAREGASLAAKSDGRLAVAEEDEAVVSQIANALKDNNMDAARAAGANAQRAGSANLAQILGASMQRANDLKNIQAQQVAANKSGQV